VVQIKFEPISKESPVQFILFRGRVIILFEDGLLAAYEEAYDRPPVIL